MATFPVHNNQGKETKTIELPDSIFGGRVNTDVIHQAVVMYQACSRQGTASTKERGSVSGGGKKPYRQKGTGRARAGSIRSPLWRGGGVVFGPHPRDFAYSIPKKIKAAALRESLNAKYLARDLICVEDLYLVSHKTKDFARILDDLKLEGKVLTIVDYDDEKLRRASANIPYVHLMRVQDVNAYDLLRAKKILITQNAFQKLLQRMEPRPRRFAVPKETRGLSSGSQREKNSAEGG